MEGNSRQYLYRLVGLLSLYLDHPPAVYAPKCVLSVLNNHAPAERLLKNHYKIDSAEIDQRCLIYTAIMPHTAPSPIAVRVRSVKIRRISNTQWRSEKMEINNFLMAARSYKTAKQVTFKMKNRVNGSVSAIRHRCAAIKMTKERKSSSTQSNFGSDAFTKWSWAG